MRKILSVLFSLFIIWPCLLTAQTSVRNSTHHIYTTSAKNEIAKLKKEIAILDAKVNQYENQNKTLLISHQQDLKYIAYMKKNIKVFVHDNLSLYQKMLQQINFLQVQIRYITPWHLSIIAQQFSSNLFLNLSLTQSAIQNLQIATYFAPLNQELQRTITLISQKTRTPPKFVVIIFLLFILLVILLIVDISARCCASRTSQQKMKLSGATRIHQEPNEVNSETFLSEEQALEESEETGSKEMSRKQDYQFLSGEDVEASKLDLGRALFEMGNLAHAKQVLESVLEEGNEQQKAEAKKLLKQVLEQNI